MPQHHKTAILEPIPMQVKMPPLSEVLEPKTIVKEAEMNPLVAELHELEPDIKSSYKDHVRGLVVDGFLPQKALKRLGLIDDVELAYRYDATQGIEGTFDHEFRAKKAEVLIEGDLQPSEELYHYLVHELSHALSNETDKEFNISMQLIQLFGGYGRTVVEEALTEHLALTMLHAQAEVINPHERDDGMTGGADYVLYREFLDLLANGGAQKIDVRDFYNALYFGTIEERKTYDNTAAVKLLTDISEAFPGIDVTLEMKDISNGYELADLMEKLREVGHKYNHNEMPEQKKTSRLKKVSALANRALSKTTLGL